MEDLSKLKERQDHHLEMARKQLMEKGEVIPATFLITEVGRVRACMDKLPRFEVMTVGGSLGKFEDAKDDVTVAFYLPNGMGYPSLLRVLRKQVSAESQEVMDELVAFAKKNSLGNAEELVCHGFLSALKLNEKDILASAIRMIVKVLKPYALIKVDEGYYIPKGTVRGKVIQGGSIRGTPGSREGIMCVLETREPPFYRFIQQGFTRLGGKIDVGPITGVEAPEVTEVDGKAANPESLEGRFVNLLAEGETGFDRYLKERLDQLPKGETMAEHTREMLDAMKEALSSIPVSRKEQPPKYLN